MTNSTATALLAPASCANTAAATGTGVASHEYEGAVAFVQQIGVVTGGSITGKIVTSDSSDLSGSSDVTFLDGATTFTAVTTSNDPLTEVKFADARALKAYVGYVGTIVTGPAVAGASMIGVKKYVG